ncbi:uncharacterized protein LOC130910803 [Corythoichthys intestinalis]|uniref:uncharacterized protein LOC130910803 n=1 Tax=Corythoichthys intestinalis TaxID=161448 RepID=UPI0025A66050|nr:uncharacterized protein LOC130910803 [Corythoichthys intestinalis]
MACGIYLGVLLICFLQAEHVRCLWASQEVEGKAYVGFVQDGDNDLSVPNKAPQNQFRQVVRASAQSGSSARIYSPNADGLYRPRVGYSSLKVVRQRPVVTPVKNEVHQKPKRPNLSSVVVSSGSVSRHHQHASHLTGRRHAGLEKPNGGDRSSRLFVAAAKKPKRPHLSTAVVSSGSVSRHHKTDGRHGADRSSVKSSLFVPGYGKRKFLANMQTSANGVATKVLIGQEPPIQKKHSKDYKNHNRGHISFHGKRHRATDTSSVADERYAPTDILIIPERYGGFPIRRLKDTGSRKVPLHKHVSHKSAAHHHRSGINWTRVKLTR